MIVALILIVIGIVFFARALGLIGGETLSILWPLLLIVVGLAMLGNKYFHTKLEGGCGFMCQRPRKK